MKTKISIPRGGPLGDDDSESYSRFFVYYFIVYLHLRTEDLTEDRN